MPRSSNLGGFDISSLVWWQGANDKSFTLHPLAPLQNILFNTPDIATADSRVISHCPRAISVTKRLIWGRAV